MKDVNVVDLFDEELTKKEKKLNKKMERTRLKEERKQKKINKKLEKQEDADFNEYLEKIKEEKLVETAVQVNLDNKESFNLDDEIKEILPIDEDLIDVPIKTNKKLNENESIEHFFKDEAKSIDDFFKINKEEILVKSDDKNEQKNIGETLFEDIKKEKKHPFLNFLIALFSIILLVVSTDYIIYNCISNYKDLPTMINSIMLVTNVIFYLLSIIVKNKTLQKIFQILSLICITLFMCYHLFII